MKRTGRATWASSPSSTKRRRHDLSPAHYGSLYGCELKITGLFFFVDLAGPMTGPRRPRRPPRPWSLSSRSKWIISYVC